VIDELAIMRVKAAKPRRAWFAPVAIGSAVAVALAGGYGAHALIADAPETREIAIPPDVGLLSFELRGRGRPSCSWRTSSSQR